MTDILELAAKVEALDGPDREVDAEIGRLVFGPDAVRQGGVGWPCGEMVVPCYPGWQALPRYTASLDAAMTLADDDWQRADALCTAMQALGNPDYMKDGAWLRLLPIRTVAAILRAKESTNEQ